MRVVVANRSEVAVRVLRTARERGYGTVALSTTDEPEAMPVRLADATVTLPGTGAAAYLDIAAVVAAASSAGPDTLVHPGYGFLSESADFAAACAEAGLEFVGPAPEVLRVFGDKVAARDAAQSAEVAVLPATSAGAGVEQIEALLTAHPEGVMIKATAGGGGRGMRIVRDPAELAQAYARCRAEARAGFGDDTVYGEALVSQVRHIEVQIAADGVHALALGDRDCSVQRHRQKLIEIAPAPNLPATLRQTLHRQAVRLAESVGCRGVVTDWAPRRWLRALSGHHVLSSRGPPARSAVWDSKVQCAWDSPRSWPPSTIRSIPAAGSPRYTERLPFSRTCAPAQRR